MTDAIKCSYDGCFKYFSSPAAMKKHKAKDKLHDYYCKKCDLDCKDDTELLFHQITSQRHMACPICGVDFRSESGRDRHVEIEHVPRQSLSCVGCHIKFDRASKLMAHIENDECEVIRLQNFQRQKAEKQIVEDTLAAAIDPIAGTTILSDSQTYPLVGTEKNLLDDERAFVHKDWQGQPQYDQDNEQNGPYVDPPSKQMSGLSLTTFPPLGPQNRAQSESTSSTSNNVPKIPTAQSDGVNRVSALQGVWANSSGNRQKLLSTPKTAARNSEPASDGNLLDSFTDDDFAFNDASPINRRPQNNKDNDKSSSLHPQPSLIPAAATALNQDPNAPYAQVQTHNPLDFPSTLSISQYWDHVLGVYVCPSQRCSTHFTTPQAFNAHLMSAPHVGGPVTCPGCYKKFKTTTALVAHCESGSRKCRIRDALDYDRVVRQITAGIIAVDGITDEGGVKYKAQKFEDW